MHLLLQMAIFGTKCHLRASKKLILDFFIKIQARIYPEIALGLILMKKVPIVD